jgi:CheY-like chemotaxis protein
MTTILLIEDDILLADCYTRWLAAGGHTVRYVGGAQAALDALDAALADAIILDILLHGANGLQFLHILRSHADFAGIPVIVCSSALSANAPDLKQYGVRAVLDKPTLNRQALCQAVAEVL